MTASEAGKIVEPIKHHKVFPFFFMDERVKALEAWAFLEGHAEGRKELEEVADRIAEALRIYISHGQRISDTWAQGDGEIMKAACMVGLKKCKENAAHILAIYDQYKGKE